MRVPRPGAGLGHRQSSDGPWASCLPVVKRAILVGTGLQTALPNFVGTLRKKLLASEGRRAPVSFTSPWRGGSGHTGHHRSQAPSSTCFRTRRLAPVIKFSAANVRVHLLCPHLGWLQDPAQQPPRVAHGFSRATGSQVWEEVGWAPGPLSLQAPTSILFPTPAVYSTPHVHLPRVTWLCAPHHKLLSRTAEIICVRIHRRPQSAWEAGSRIPSETRTHKCSSPSYKMP